MAHAECTCGNYSSICVACDGDEIDRLRAEIITRTKIADKWQSQFSRVAKENADLRSELLAAENNMRTIALDCCHMYAKDCGCADEIAAEIMRSKK